MKKEKIKKRKKIEIIIFAILAFVSTSILLDQVFKKGGNFEVKKAEYKFYIKNPTTGEYEEQTGMTFPGEGYYLDEEKTNAECANSVISQENDLSVKSLVKFSTVCDLYYNPNGILTVTSNASTAVATIKNGNEVIETGTVPISASIMKGKNITITVSDPEYYHTETNGTYNDYEETISMPGTNTTKNITLNERPWITGTIANSSNTTAKNQTDINWHPGYYLVEVWGGAGGAGDQAAGASGYVYGVIYIPYSNYAISSAGGNGGSSTNGPNGGANGGGRGGSSSSNLGIGGNKGAGGGYSSFIITDNSSNSAVSQAAINNGYVKFIAGGGGGSSAKGGTLGNTAGGAGGAGGNMSSTVSSITAGKVFSGSNGVGGGNNTNTPGKGGSTSAGGAGSGASAGSLLAGGNAVERGGGGGAGYYGGGGGGVASIFATNPGGGGGGSSFIASDVTYTNLPSSVTNKLTSTNPSSTGGAIKIQWIGKNMP